MSDHDDARCQRCGLLLAEQPFARMFDGCFCDDNPRFHQPDDSDRFARHMINQMLGHRIYEDDEATDERR